MSALEPPVATSRAAGTAQEPPRPGLVALTLALVALVLVFAARATTPAEGGRASRRVELVELIAAEEARVAAMEQRVEELTTRLERLRAEGSRGRDAVTALQGQIDGLAAPVGLTPVRGPGLVVTLSDSTLANSPSGDLNDLVIHEQDLQAVINALWSGGAEAMAVNGQRVLATTAIRCVGNTLLLHGAVYSPPYVIEAIGDAAPLQDGLGRDPVVARLREAATRFSLGLSVARADELELSAYTGSAALQVARPGGAVESG